MKEYVLTIENFLKVEQMKIPLKPGVVGLVGKNAQGKTTVLNALSDLISGKNDFTKIRDGAERAVVRLEEFIDGENTKTIQRTQSKEQTKLEANGLRPGQTASGFLNAIINEIAINPVQLAQEGANPVDYLKKHIDVRLLPEDLMVVGLQPSSVAFEMNGFTALDQLTKIEESDRLLARKGAEQLAGAVADLKKGMPEENTEPFIDTEELLAADVEALQAEAAEVAGISERKKGLMLVVDERKKVFSRAVQEHKDAVDREAELEEELINIREIKEQKAKRIQECDTSHQEAIEAADKVVVPTVDDLAARKQQLRDRADKIKASNSLRQRWEVIHGKEKERDQKMKDFNKLDERVKFMKYELPKKLMERCKLPIEGLEFREGELFVGGHALSRLSTAERAVVTTKIAIAIAKQKGHIAVCLDGVENLDEAHRQEFLKEAEASGVCILYTRQGSPENSFEREVSEGKLLNA